MAAVYCGYGFDVNDLEAGDLLKLVKEHDPGMYAGLIEYCMDACGGCDDETLLCNVDEYISRGYDSTEDYVMKVLNACEHDAAGGTDIFTVYGKYIVFDSIRFVGDNEKRAMYVKTQGDFIEIVGRYLPVEKLEFGNIFDGVDWADPNYYMDD